MDELVTFKLSDFSIIVCVVLVAAIVESFLFYRRAWRYYRVRRYIKDVLRDDQRPVVARRKFMDVDDQAPYGTSTSLYL
jgi:hypothetical protein